MQRARAKTFRIWILLYLHAHKCKRKNAGMHTPNVHTNSSQKGKAAECHEDIYESDYFNFL